MKKKQKCTMCGTNFKSDYSFLKTMLDNKDIEKIKLMSRNQTMCSDCRKDIMLIELSNLMV